MSDVLKQACTLAIHYAAVGSRVTCNPPPLDTDEDWLLLVGDLSVIDRLMQSAGWQVDGSRVSDDVNYIPIEHWFYSWSKDRVNIVCTTSDVFYRRFIAASSIAKRFNLLDKVDRIALFQAVLYGNADEENAP